MKRMDLIRELRAMNIIELKTRINELNTQLLNTRIKLKEGLLKNPLSLRALRHNIARVNTILSEKEKQTNHG